MKELDRIIEDYLKAKNTDYAIMINGDWGSGKSYYIKHDFQKVVISVKCDVPETIREKTRAKITKGTTWASKLFHHNKEQKTPEYIEDRYFPFYVSLYGVSSVADFDGRVAEGVHDWVSKGLNMANTFSEGKFNVKLPLGSKAYIQHNAVLVFDDMERICADKISPVEILGLINSYAEHQNKKVIIVCNEAEFAKSAEGKETDPEFLRYKEKTIRFAYTYLPDIPAVYDTFANEHVDAYGEYLKREKDFILALFAKGGKRNLRTLKFFVDIYKKIFEIADVNLHGDYKNEVMQKQLITTLIYVMEYKQGAKQKQLERLGTMNTNDTETWLEHVAEKYATTQQSDKPEPFSIQDVQHKYGGLYDEMEMQPWMITYIMTGALADENVKEFVIGLVQECKRKAVNPAVQEAQRLKYFTMLDDEDVQLIVAKVWENIEKDQYTMFELLDIYSTFVKYTINKINGVELNEKDDVVFKKAMERAAKNHTYNPAFDIKAVRWDSSAERYDEVKRYYALRNYAKELNERANTKEYMNEVEQFMAIVEAGTDIQAIVDYASKAQSELLSLQGVDWNRIYNALMTIPNPMACTVIQCIERLLANDYSTWDSADYEALDAFQDKLKLHVEEGDGRIRGMFMKELVSTINDFLKNRI